MTSLRLRLALMLACTPFAALATAQAPVVAQPRTIGLELQRNFGAP